MSTFLPYVVIGLTSGAIYGLAGVGLVLTYRTSGIFNFAHGALATAGAYLFFELWVKHGMPWPLALLVCVAGLGVLFGTLLELLARRLTNVPPAIAVVATIGPLLVVVATTTQRYGAASFQLPSFLPTGSFRVLSVYVGYNQLIVFLVGVVVSAALAVLLTRTRLGIAMRGVVDDSELMELTGFGSTTVRRAAWIIGGTVAVLSGVLLAPSIGVNPIGLTFLVVQAFGAAAIGRFRSLPYTFAGGLIIGIFASIGTKYAGDFPTFDKFPNAVPFLALFGVLVIVGKRGLPTEAFVRRPRLDSFTALPTALRLGAVVPAMAVVLLLPTLVGPRLPVFINAAGFFIMFLSLGLLVKIAGQVSLCQASLVAVGAVAFSRLTVNAHLPWLLALIGAGLITLPVGALVAIPAIRLSGIYLALATFAFQLLMENLLYRTPIMFGNNETRLAPRPHLPGIGVASQRQYFFIAVALMVVVALVVGVLLRSRLGRLLGALADSPLALSTFGTSTTTTLVLLFAVSAFFAGIAGAVIAVGTGTAGAGGLSSLQSLLWIAVISITGARLVSSSLLAALLLTVLPSYLPGSSANYQTIGFGVLAVAAALLSASEYDWVARVKEDVRSSTRLQERTRRSARVAPARRRVARDRTSRATRRAEALT